MALILALTAAACTGDDLPEVETALVGPGEVVQTIAAAARIEPAGRVTLVAPASGPIAELFVDDGDEVVPGDPLLRLSEDAIADQIAAAEGALEAAGSLSGLSIGAGFDLAPVLAAFRGTFESVFPALLGALAAQVDATEAAVTGVIATAASAADAQAEAVATLAQAVADAVAESALGEIVELDPDLVAGLELGADPEQVAEALLAAEVAARDARTALAETEAAFRAVAGGLAGAEAEAVAATDAADAAQRAAVEAQREQAELALEAAQARIDDLTLVAPVGGVVELAPADGAGATDLGALAGLGGAGALGGLAGLGDLADLGDLDAIADRLGAGAGAGAGVGAGTSAGGAGIVRVDGPIAAGVEVSAGQPLVVLYDLSAFTADLEVDELDIIEVEVGQPVTVLVDAFPGAELAGEVRRVAITPARGATGAALYPVSVALTDPPADVRLRVGLNAAAEIEVRRVEGERVVPTSALLRRGGQEVVFVVRDGRAVEVAVEVLAIGDDTAALEGEVQPGERVVTIGVELVADGDEVAS